MKQLTASDILATFGKKGYVPRNKAYEMNIVAIRTKDNTANSFNDIVGLFFIDEKSKWQWRQYDCTTDAGLFYRLNPINVNGTAIIVPGNYKQVYKIGLHKGEMALEQVNNLKYIRDNNKNAILDWVYDKIGTKYEVANNKTNVHKAGKASTQVDKWSAGCIVVGKETDFITMMSLCRSSVSDYKFANLFDLTLFEEKDFN